MMNNPFKSFDVFEFRDDEQLTETGSKRMASISDQLSSREHVSGGTGILSTLMATTVCGSMEAGNINYNGKAADTFTHLETEQHEYSSSLNHVMRFKFGSPDQSTEITSNIPKSESIRLGVERGSVSEAFPDISRNGQSDCLAPDADESVSGRSSSHVGYNSDASDGPSSDKYFSGLDMDEETDVITFYPDYLCYGGLQYLNYVVKFSKSSVEVSNSTSSESGSILHIHVEVDDIVKIESRWSAHSETGIMNIHFIPKDAIGNDTLHSASGIQEFCFLAIDSSWHKKQEAIESLNVRYKALWDFLLDTGMERGSAYSEEKAAMPRRSYFPNFNMPFDEVIYPKGDPDAVSISKRDVDLLQPEVFVNDTIIDFYIKYLKTKLNEKEKVKFHFFNSFFFRKLADMDKDPSSAQDGKAAFLRVRKWTRKVNFLEKDFIFIPVNYAYHWSLIVICYFGEAGSNKDVDSANLARVPCVLHMDSLKGSHAGLKDLMQSYLWEEWKERNKEACEDLYSKFKTLEFVSLELPQQQNMYDCGLFLLHYVELFLEDVPKTFNIHKITSPSKFLCADWFQPEEVSMKRVRIEKLIDNLISGHSEDCSTSGGNDTRFPDGPNNADCKNGLELLGEPSALARYQKTSLRPEVGQGIEMTLLHASSVSSTQCTRSPEFVLKELFESGSVSETFNDTPWQEFEQKGCPNGMERLDSVIEENAEADECFSQTELLQPMFQHQNGIPTGANGFPCSSDLVSHPSDHVATHDLDISLRGSDIGAFDVEAMVDAQCEGSKCVPLGVTNNLTMSLESPPRDVLNDTKPRNLGETREENDSQNMVVYEAANESPPEHITPDDIKANVVQDESRLDSEEQHAPKRMPITPDIKTNGFQDESRSDSEEQHALKMMPIIHSDSEGGHAPKRRRISPPESL